MRSIAVFLVLTLTANIAFASEYDVQCLNHKGKFSSCKVTINDENIQIAYKDKKNQDLNVEIPGKGIKSISAGEYARRRVGESVAAAVILAPIFLFTLFSKKKRDHIGIEYVQDPKDKNATTKATLIEIKKKYGMAMKTELKAVSGKEIIEEEAKK